MFASHEQLLQLLYKLLRIAPSLVSADILAYLHAVGIDVDTVLNISQLSVASNMPSAAKTTGFKSVSIFTNSPLPIAMGLDSMPPTPMVSRRDDESSSVQSFDRLQNSGRANSRSSSFAVSRSSRADLGEERAALEINTSF